MSEYHVLSQDLMECKSEKELLKVVKDIVKNKSRYGLDDFEMNKLEQIGMKRYEQIDRERREMFRNRKFGN